MSSTLILFIQNVCSIIKKRRTFMTYPRSLFSFRHEKFDVSVLERYTFFHHTGTIEVATFHSSSNENRKWLILRNTSGTIPENSCFLSPPSALVANHLLQQYQGKQCQTNPNVHLCAQTLCQILCLQEDKKSLHKYIQRNLKVGIST